MIEQKQIDEARKRLEDKWDDEGHCGGCGWHACLYEHRVTDEDIAEALEERKGMLELSCRNKDFGDCGSWGRIYIGEE